MNSDKPKKSKRPNPLEDDNVWAAMVAHKFARHPAINLPPGNLWEPGIARSLVKAVKEGRHSRDGVEMLMALQLGITEQRVEER